MALITITEKDYNENNLLYVQSATAEVLNGTGCRYGVEKVGSRSVLRIDCLDEYADIISAEVADKLAEIVAINYKNEFLKKTLQIGGLCEIEKEILLTSLIAADLEDDKRYAFERLKGHFNVAVDGIYNFRLQPLKRKWEDVVSYMPSYFMKTQLKEFISYLLENKKKRIYIEGGTVYDSHYRRLKRSKLLCSDKVNLLKEVLLSNCGEISLTGNIPEEDEKYLREFFGDKIYCTANYFN